MSSEHSHTDAAEAQGAVRWLFGAGAFAVGLSIFLATTDYKLSHSDKEQVLGRTLHELRTAQASLPSRVTDRRGGNSLAGYAGGEPVAIAESASGHHNDHEVDHHE